MRQTLAQPTVPPTELWVNDVDTTRDALHPSLRTIIEITPLRWEMTRASFR